MRRNIPAFFAGKLLATAILSTLPCLGLFAEEADDNTQRQDEEFVDKEFTTIQGAIMGKVAERRLDSPTPAPEVGTRRWQRSDIASVPQFGGYIIGSYKYSDLQGAHGGDGFGLRLVRLYVDGTVMKDFKYRLQMEVNGTPHIKDATLEWAHWKQFSVKAGQFKRCFTFENPMNPWDISFGDYSMASKMLSGFNDRCGETSGNGGRDLGLQVQGDLFPSRRDGHQQLHYQVAMYNGQGINKKDADRSKDFIGTLQWSPVKYLWLGAFGWNGHYTAGDVTVLRRRYAFGLKYENPENHWSARAEYIRSCGHKVSDYVAATESTPAHWVGGDKADAWYALVGVPVWRWIKVNAKYEAYRDQATWGTMHSIYALSTSLQPHKNLMLQVEYSHHDDRTRATDQHYNQFWVQTYVRF